MITLGWLCGEKMKQEVGRKLDRAVNKAYMNILDAETDQSEKRTVTLKITMKPDPEAGMIEVTADVSAKTAKEKGLGTFVQMDPDQLIIEGVDRLYRGTDPETGEIMEAEDE